MALLSASLVAGPGSPQFVTRWPQWLGVDRHASHTPSYTRLVFAVESSPVGVFHPSVILSSY